MKIVIDIDNTVSQKLSLNRVGINYFYYCGRCLIQGRDFGNI